jgi:penicillin-binding protein 1C
MTPRRRRLAAWIGAVVAVALALALALEVSFVAVPLPERLAAGPSPVVRWRDGSPAHVFLAPDDRVRVEVEVEDVDPAYVAALLRFEDKRFYLHPGVDGAAVLRAVWRNLAAGRVETGASTITMQLVRVLEPRPRTMASKVVEAWRALQLERHLSKDEILAAYLTFAPYGRNVEGVGAASWAYFGHGAEALSADEIATLLAVPQAPTARYPTPGNAGRLRAARDEIAAWLASEGALPLGEGAGEATVDAQLATVRGRPVPTAMRPFPRHVPEVARWLVARHPDRRDLTSTLDRGAQRVVEELVRRDADGRLARGIRHTSVVLADPETGDVLALIGAVRPDGDGPGDQVPMFDVPRSPGSALKPLLYAQGIDQGLVLPDRLVRDLPVSYYGYAPRNYEGGYDGLVRLEDALSRSLNVPFVLLLEELGVDAFIGALGRLGAQSLRSEPGWYGLSAAVGGVELTPLEVTAAYVALANDGVAVPLRVTGPEDPPAAGVPVFAPGAAWLTRKALRLRDRPDFPARRDIAAVPVGIHWKTGTSFGHRDAWACGSGPAHTACVWLGNADMTPSRHLVGAEAAGDLLFDVLEAVGPRGAWADPPPPDLARVTVDAWSGYLPSAASPSTREVWALRHRVPTAVDPFHVRVEVDATTGEAVTPACRGRRATETRTYVRLPTSIRRWLAEQQRRLPEPPRYAEGCVPPGQGDGPRITTPAPGEVRMLIPGLDPSAQEVPLSADSALGGALSWFVDGVYLGEFPAEERVFWTPTAGSHEVVARDAAGRTARARFTVRAGPRGVGGVAFAP